MNAWRWFRARPRFQRTAIALLAMLPVMLLLIGDGDAIPIWLFVACITLIPPFVVTRLIEPVDGVDALHERHPAHARADRLELVVMIVVGVMFVAASRLLA